MLRPWFNKNYDPDAKKFDWFVFERQSQSWRYFRLWQKFHRKIFRGWRHASQYFGEEYHLQSVYVDGVYKRFVRAYQLWDGGLLEYVEAVKKLLAQHGFAQPFQFLEDPMQQDKLTTWIEYLGYEQWISESRARYLQRTQPKYDEAWTKLVDSNVLRPFETEEYICDIISSFQRQREREQAQRAVESARSAAEAVLISAHKDANNPWGSRFTSQARAQMMLAAKSRLDAAKESLESIKRRNGLVTEFRQATGKYREQKRYAERHRPRLQWILDQVPLIEAELNEPSAAETCSNAARGTKRRLGDVQDDEAMRDQSPKKRRRSPKEPGSPPDRNAGSGPQGERPKHGRDNPIDDGPPSKRLKNGGEHSGSHETSDGAGAQLVKGLREATKAGHEVGKLHDDEHAEAKVIQESGLKAGGPSNSRLLRKKSTRNAPQLLAVSQPLRRSARIAARQEVSRAVVSRSGVAKCPPRGSRRRMDGLRPQPRPID